MKFGVIMHKTTQNIGDDIQTFAAMQHLPHTDYFLDRECLDEFRTEDGKPAAVLMAAWYMWNKWNWPPSDYIVPLLTGMHFSDHQASEQVGSPVKTEFLTGCGAEYMNANGPVGCRDMYTLNKFKELGLDAFFSGCITLTLPKMEKKTPEKEYICAVDLPPEILKKLKEIVAGRCEIIETTHYKDYRNSDATWEEREKAVIELLTIYQNAKCVVTRRLHCALPCLAMEVPVFVTNRHKRPVSGRFDPYYDWIKHCTYKTFLAEKFKYDFLNPPQNSKKYLPVREDMIKSIEEFVEKYKDENGDPKDYVKTTYTEEELYKWKAKTMRECMNAWFKVTDAEERELKELRHAFKEYEEMKREVIHQRKVLSCSSVQKAIKLRNMLMPKNKKIRSYEEIRAARIEAEKLKAQQEKERLKAEQENKQ